MGSLAATGQVEFWHVMLGGLLTGATQSPLKSARFTLVMDLVGREGTSSATELNMATFVGGGISAPTIGVRLIVSYGVEVALWSTATWYLPALGTMIRLRSVPRNPVTSGNRVTVDLAEGFHLSMQ